MTVSLIVVEGASKLGGWSIWVMYVIGQFLHIISTAYYAIISHKNATDSFGKYLAVRWVPIVSRLFLTTATFVLAWNNPSILDLERFMPNVASKIAMACILGWFSDSLFDKVISLVPMLRGELPSVPPPGESS